MTKLETLEPLYPAFNRAVHYMIGKLLGPSRVETTDDPEWATFENVRQHFLYTGKIRVWSGGSDCTIFGDAHTNHLFRAWHDFVHIVANQPFTLQGESRVALIQAMHLDNAHEEIGNTEEEQRIVKKLLFGEVIAQAEYHSRTGKFVTDQRQFMRDYMRNEHGITL